jgi:membrane-bound lytic murein transglycosylase D
VVASNLPVAKPVPPTLKAAPPGTEETNPTLAPVAPIVVANAPPPPREPVSERQADTTALLPATTPTGNGDPTNYKVGADDTVVVQAAETLGHFADWTHVDSQSLRALNKLHKNAMVTFGHKVKLDFSKVSAEDFTAARRAYHHDLQESFFATHRIAGTDNYTVKRGDSLWVIAQQHGGLPQWLMSQYNPDVDLGDVKPGNTITLPRVVPINRE